MRALNCGSRSIALVLASCVLLLALCSTLGSDPSHDWADDVRTVLQPAAQQLARLGHCEAPDPPLLSRTAVYSGYRTAVFPVAGEPKPAALKADACDICFCPHGYVELGSHERPQLSAELRVGGPVRDVADVGLALRSVQLATICPSIHVHNASLVGMMLNAEPVETLAFNVSSLTPRAPTLYFMTSKALRRAACRADRPETFPSGKLTHETRGAYFSRHVDTIKRHRKLVEANGFADGTPASERQLLWVIVRILEFIQLTPKIEDAHVIDQNVVRLLQDSGVSFFYFALGPTHHYGNAQIVRASSAPLLTCQNGFYMATHALSRKIDGVFGHGPAISIDDDAEIHERLLDVVWRVRGPRSIGLIRQVKRVGVWPVGNMKGTCTVQHDLTVQTARTGPAPARGKAQSVREGTTAVIAMTRQGPRRARSSLGRRQTTAEVCHGLTSSLTLPEFPHDFNGIGSARADSLSTLLISAQSTPPSSIAICVRKARG